MAGVLHRQNLILSNRQPSIVVIGVCLYIASIVMQPKFLFDVPLFLLSLIAVYATVSNLRSRSITSLPLIVPVFVFLVAMVMSILGSDDIVRSTRQSLNLMPAVLLYVLIAGYIHNVRDTRYLYFSFTLVALGLVGVSFWAVYRSGVMKPSVWLSLMNSSMIIVVNDLIVLAVIAPLSLALFYLKPKSAAGIIAALSVLLSICITVIYQSRSALLTMIASITCFFILVRHRIWLAIGLVIFIITFLVDRLLGFKLVTKFSSIWYGDSRFSLWASAWTDFLNAPLLGHGPYTFIYKYPSKITTYVHNLYLEALAERGIIGLMALLLLLFYGLSEAWKLRRATSAELKVFGCAAFSALASFCFASVFDLTLSRLWVVIMMFSLLGIIAHLSLINKDIKEIET